MVIRHNRRLQVPRILEEPTLNVKSTITLYHINTLISLSNQEISNILKTH